MIPKTILFLTFYLFFHFSFSQEKVSWEELRCEKSESLKETNVRSVVLNLILNHKSELDSIQNVFFGRYSSQNEIFWFTFNKFNDLKNTEIDSISVQYLKLLVNDDNVLFNKWKPWLQTDRTAFLTLRDSLLLGFKETHKNLKIKIASDIRNRESQSQILKQGSSLANISFHEWGLASDFAIYRNNKYQRMAKYYHLIEEFTKKYQLRWGGNFVGFVDYPHIQYYYNGAELLRKHPYLAIEYEFFYNKYLERVRQKINENLEFQVEDTKELLQEINKLRKKEVCFCDKTTLEKFPVAIPSNYNENSDLLILLDDEEGKLIVQFPNQAIVKYQKGEWK